MIKLKEPITDILAQEMKNGELGVITSWNNQEMIGVVVQRYDSILIRLGMPSGYSWTSFLEGAKYPECRVRILKPGTELVVA